MSHWSLGWHSFEPRAIEKYKEEIAFVFGYSASPPKMRWRPVQSSLTSTMSRLQISFFLSRSTRSRPIQKSRSIETSSCPCQSWAGSICIFPHFFFISQPTALGTYISESIIRLKARWIWNKCIEVIVGHVCEGLDANVAL